MEVSQKQYIMIGVLIIFDTIYYKIKRNWQLELIFSLMTTKYYNFIIDNSK